MPGEFDMRRMQEDAARRAREMQSRARMPQPRRGQPEPKPPQEPPAPQPQPEPEPPAMAQPPAPVAAASALGSLFQDKERTIILALLILLGSEEGSQELMFALLFLLM